MKRWRRYERYLPSGLWHVHTDRTDGEHGPARLADFAADRGFPLLGITEHVRRELTYDFDELYREAKRAAEAAGVRCAVGCEAKVLDADGTLDVADGTLERADVVYAAYHGVPFSRAGYLDSIRAMAANPAVDVWAHPFAYAAERGFEFDDDELADVAARLRDGEVLFELNLRRPAGAVADRPEFRSLDSVVGYDLHDLGRWEGADGGGG